MSRSSCAASTAPASPTVTQNTPSGNRRRTISSRANAAANTDLPIPPWPCNPSDRTCPVTPTAPDSTAATASISAASSSRAT